MIKRETVYFEEGGFQHTEITLDLTIQAAKELGIKHVVVSSTTGETGVKAAEKFKDNGINLVVVGHQTGFPTPGLQRFTAENKKKIKELGGKVNLGSDVLTNSIRMRQRMGHSHLSYITLTTIAMKVKVNVEIVAKACDAGQIPVGEPCISVAGSHSGADTSVAFKAADTPNILDIRPLYYIAIPISREKADAEYMAKRRAAAEKK